MAIKELFFGTRKPQADVPTFTLPKKWPLTVADEARIKEYARYRAIWTGDHALALDEQDIAGKYGQYVTVNLAKILVTIPADFLFGEAFELTRDQLALLARNSFEAAFVDDQRRSALMTELAEFD